MNAFTTQDCAWKDWRHVSNILHCIQDACYGYPPQRCRMPIGRDIDLHVEDAETTGLDNDSESISGLDTTIALGGPEAEGHPMNIPSNQAKLTVLTREINDLHQ